MRDENTSELPDDDGDVTRSQYPPDRPLGLDDRGVTDAGDSVGERRRRELPDRGSGHTGRGEVGTLVDQADDAGVDDESDAVARTARRTRDPLGLDVSVQDLEEVESAEEAAMHLTDDPPMGDGDGYLD